MKSKHFKRALKEVKKSMSCCRFKKKTKSYKGLWIGLAMGVVAALIGLVLWLRSKNEEDIEEYYEYFDDELDDELEDDLYAEEDSDEDVEYVKIKNFSDEDEVAQTDLQEDEESLKF